MLKRQRPATPPPASLDSSPYFPGRSFRPLPQRASDATSLSERSKRRRVLDSTPTGPCDSWKEESDGKDDWVGDDDAGSPSTCRTGMDYKRPNGLLHELHVLHQHRLMFSPSDHLNSTYGVLPPPIYAHPNVHGNVDAASFLPQSSPGKSPVPQSSLTSVPSAPHGQMRQPHPGQAVLHEAESVWEHYEGTNRLLGSLFLSRRRELHEAFSSSAAHGASESQQE